MALADIFRLLGLGFLTIGLAAFAPVLVGLTQAGEPIGAYVFGGVIASLVGGLCLVIGRRRRQAGGVREAILFVILWWFVAPAFGALPLVASGLTIWQSYFEASSALTTTGSWLSEAGARASGAGMLWRALLQWIGGIASLALAAAVFVQPLFVGVETAPPKFARRERDSYFSAIESAIGYMIAPYVLVTAVCWLALLSFGAPPLEAAVTALSAAASGGFFVEGGGQELSPVFTGALTPFVFISGMSFAIIARPATSRRADLDTREVVAYASIIAAVALILVALSGSVTPSQVSLSLFNAASLLSTNGVVIGETPNLPIALVAAIIGGSAISTAGGLKVLRWLVLMRRFREEVRQLVTPRAVSGRTFVSNEMAVWMHFLVFTFAVGALMLVLTASGQSFDVSAAAAVGVLSNAGPVIHLVEAEISGYGVIANPVLQAALVAGMVLGRIEAVAALALFNLAFWRS